MKRFVISHIDWFDHELTSAIIWAENEVMALRYALIGNGVELTEGELTTVQDLKQLAFDCDCMVNAIEI